LRVSRLAACDVPLAIVRGPGAWLAAATSAIVVGAEVLALVEQRRLSKQV
jgi:hypothetical protein